MCWEREPVAGVRHAHYTVILAVAQPAFALFNVFSTPRGYDPVIHLVPGADQPGQK
jgi:hypothetical protein